MADALRSIGAAAADGLVLDLRGNGGGSFPAAVDVARLLLPGKGAIVYIADSDGVRDVFDSNGTPALAPDTPLVLLVDRGYDRYPFATLSLP